MEQATDLFDNLEGCIRKPLEMLTEELPLQQYVGDNISQAVVEGEVALPGGLREETNVLSVEGMAVLTSSNAQLDRIDVDGKVTFHVLYTQGDPTHVSALEASAEFTHNVVFEGANTGMTAPVSLMVEHVQASAQGGRLRVMAILRVQTRILSDEPISVVTGLENVEGLMMKTEKISGCQPVGSGKQDVLIRDECELSGVLQITDTLYATATAVVQDVMGGEERATIIGNILLEVTHASTMPQRPLVITRHTIPFEETLSLMGENGDSLCCNATVKDVAVLSQEGQEEGERTMRAEILLCLTAQATRKCEMNLMLDAYTTKDCMIMPKKQAVIRALSHRQVHTAESGKMTLLLDGQAPARTPLRATLRPVVTDTLRAGGKLCIEGMMAITFIYMTDENNIPRTYETEEPFQLTFTSDITAPESIIVTPSNVEVSGITSDRVEIKYILHMSCYDIELADEPLVIDIRQEPAPSVESGIMLYFSQPGETLWDIAKRYRVSCESLQRMNPALQEVTDKNLQPVILWRRGNL